MSKANKDNPAFEYASTHAYSEPDIYFDEQPDEQQDFRRATGIVRLILVRVLQLASGDQRRLHAILGTIAGLPLRDISKLSGISHESVRIHLNAVRAADPVFYDALVRPGKARIDALIPHTSPTRWRITPPGSRPFYTNSLTAFCQEQGFPYDQVMYRVRNRQPYKGYLVEKMRGHNRVTTDTLLNSSDQDNGQE